MRFQEKTAELLFSTDLYVFWGAESESEVCYHGRRRLHTQNRIKSPKIPVIFVFLPITRKQSSFRTKFLNINCIRNRYQRKEKNYFEIEPFTAKIWSWEKV